MNYSANNEMFQVKPHTLLRDKNESYNRNPKTVTYGIESISFWRLKNLVISTTKNKKILFLKIYEEMETKLSILVMKNVLVTCFFYKNLLNLYLSIFIFCVYISRYCYKLCFCYTLQFSLYYSSLLVIFFPYEDQKIEVSDSLVTELV